MQLKHQRAIPNERSKLAAEAGIFLLVGIVTALVNNLFLQWGQNDLSVSLALKFAFQWHTEIFLLGTGVLFVVYVWFASLFGNKWVGAGSLTLLSVSLGIATYQKMTFRGEPLYPVDLKMATEISFLVEMMGVPLAVFLAIVLFASFTGIGILLYRQTKKETSASVKRWRRAGRAAGFLLSTLGLIYIGQFNEPGNRLKAAYDPHAYWIPYSQDMNYYNNGFVGGFLYNLQTKPMEKPSAYSKERMKDLTEKYRSFANSLNEEREGALDEVNVVFIMNESFSDPLRLKGFHGNKDPISYFRSLREESLSGMTLAQGYGGGTGNSEFEALTGLSLEPFAPTISSPYTQIADKMHQLPSVVRRLKRNGHHATAIHPYNTTMYKRQDVYRSLGFDDFLYADTMRYTGTVGSNLYISDREAYREALVVMEETEEKDFIHLVTMQNHMPYGTKYPHTSFQSRGSGNKEEADGYLQDLAYSDQALRFLIAELERVDEHVLVVFWGDHLPSFYGENVTQQNSELALHQTPLLIYSNKLNLQGSVGTISPVFLMNQVTEAVDAEKTPFDALLTALSARLPAFEKGMYVEAGEPTPKKFRSELSPKASQLLEEYHLLQYDLTTGEQYAKELGFFD
ncbi:LTA synthase family protein [Atopococcus tabaci]|uniref:LTA synthase family protein n=1 Tax=Atopococcus tabaci TaxID=269774 RepID=UPI0003F6E419|nr:alkaline phosphatase family protein [Atopococcus tabaci]